MEGAFLNGEAAEDFAGGENAGADAADHFFEADAVGEGVIILRAGEFAEADGHHLKEAAFDAAGEICVPLDAGEKEDAVGFEGGFVHEGGDAFGGSADGDDIERTDDGATHGGFMDAVVHEDVCLALGGSGAVAAHGGNDEGLGSVFLPEIDGGFGDAGDVGNATAADADSDACAFGDTLDNVGGRKLLADAVFDVRDGAIGERLFGADEPWKVHVLRILNMRLNMDARR